MKTITIERGDTVGATKDLYKSDLTWLDDGEQDYVMIPNFTIGKVVGSAFGGELVEVHFLGISYPIWVRLDQFEVLGE